MKIDSNNISSSFVINAKADPYDIDLKLTLVGDSGEPNVTLTCMITCGGHPTNCAPTCGICRR